MKPIVGHDVCNGCYRRKGQLVCQDAMPAQRSMMPPIMEPWVFRYYLCPWCRGWWNRRRMKGQKRMTVKTWKPDSEVLTNAKEQLPRSG